MHTDKKSRTEQTREAILEAALQEFSAFGYEGTRMESVARRAGRNKSLVYRYFTDKDSLFRAAMTHLFQGRERVREAVPEQLDDALAYWFTQTTDTPAFMRLIMQEALAHRDDRAPAEAAFRSAYYARQIAHLQSLQHHGTVDAALDPTYLFAALTALISWPSAFPQIVQLITGHTPDQPAFQAEWTRMLRALAARLAPRAAGPPEG